MNRVVAQALTLWGMTGAKVHLVATRENHVFRVSQSGLTYALRLHRKGYRSDAELRSELEWMAAMARAGISTPAPVPATDGPLIHVIEGVQVDILTWLSGQQMGETGTPLLHPDKQALFANLGSLLAKLHDASDAWHKPDGFTRPSWDAEGLVGKAPLWGQFWENPALTDSQRGQMLRLRDRAHADLATSHLDYGLIHADAVRENVLVDGERLHLIDYDDGGFGYRLFDIATALVKNIDEPDYPAIRNALIKGYNAERAIDMGLLDLFLALRAATYVGWIMPRMAEPRGAPSAPRLIEAAERLIAIALER